jgi:hypothetical protein
MSKEAPSERHNRHTSAFVQSIVKEVIEDGGSYAEVMVVLESLILGVMLVNVKAFNLKPQVASGLVEGAVQRAIERFAALKEQGP